MQDQNLPTQQASALADELELFDQYEEASTGQRFANFFVDNLLMRFGLTYVTGYSIGYILGNIAPEYMMELAYKEDNSIDLLLFGYGIGLFNYLIYYTICEKVFKGYTLGKLLSGTRAIRADGGELTFKDAFLRSLCRLVPFEQFSIWSGNGLWHDSWTKTRVVKAR
ncbi:RDD family protein [Terrimonas ferruginea]|uniref:RDD family protein n=1 Tax=Terrimonas ferruginea TaxID=249 RepID=UPI0004036FBD|nr:RDD family protein [Terrimonas ferruginea]